MNDRDRQQGFEQRKRRDDRGYKRQDLEFEMRFRRETSLERQEYSSYEPHGNEHWSYENVREAGNRHRGRCQQNRYEQYEEEEESRRCLECESFPGAVKCNRCCNAEVQQPAATTENSHEVDEFGRSKKTKPKIIWPPPFEESGSAFVLDCRTGMFHEAKSDFFYDPKTKMYFCNSNRVYYTYKTETKRFREAENTSAAPDPTGNSSTDLVPIMDNSSVPEKNESKKTISIKLTTKTVAKQVEKVEDNEAALSRVAKKHAVDMAKWSVRQTEKRSKTAVATEMKLVRTAKGEPVCLVCRRKFKSVETLRLHEKSSQLHKTSLEKTQSMFESKYADRARQRRELHDEFDSSLIQSGSVASVQPKVDQQEDSAAASLQIGEAMLRKVGWTEDETHQGAPALRREWSRIEAIASNKKVGTSSQPMGLGIK